MTEPDRSADSAATDDERELIRRAREGAGDAGEAAFRALYERHADEVHAFVLHLTRDPEVAEDALQEGFVRVFTRLDTFDPARPFRPWVLTVAKHAALDALRARGKQDRLAAAAAARPPQGEPRSVPAEAARREAVARTRAALAALPDETRALLMGRHAAGLPLADLARSFACTERTIRNRLKAAAARLAEALVGPEGSHP